MAAVFGSLIITLGNLWLVGLLCSFSLEETLSFLSTGESPELTQGIDEAGPGFSWPTAAYFTICHSEHRQTQSFRGLFTENLAKLEEAWDRFFFFFKASLPGHPWLLPWLRILLESMALVDKSTLHQHWEPRCLRNLRQKADCGVCSHTKVHAWPLGSLSTNVISF